MVQWIKTLYRRWTNPTLLQENSDLLELLAEAELRVEDLHEAIRHMRSQYQIHTAGLMNVLAAASLQSDEGLRLSKDIVTAARGSVVEIKEEEDSFLIFVTPNESEEEVAN